MRSRLVLTFSTAALALLAVGCASSTSLQIKRAPELNLTGVKTVKVQTFDVSGDLNLDLVSADGLWGAMVNASLDASANALASKKDSGMMKQNLMTLRKAIADNAYFKLTDGDDYDALITGSSFYDVKDEGEDGSTKERDGSTTYWYQIKRKVTTKSTFTVTAKSGAMMAIADVSGSQTSSVRADSRSNARSKLESWPTLVRQSFSQTNDALVRKIAPYYVTERRTFATGDDKTIKDANKSAEQGQWDAALPIWKAALNGTAKDKPAALHNLAIYDEYQGNVDDALVKYQEVQKLEPTSSHSADVSRTLGRIEEIKRLKEAELAKQAAPAPVVAPAPVATPIAAPAPTPAAAPAKATPSKKSTKIN